MNIFQRIGYYIIMAIFLVIRILPKPIQQLLAFVIYFLVAHVVGYRKKVILTNLRNSFPEKSEAEIKRIANKYYLHLSYMIIEAIDLRFTSKKRISKCLELTTFDELESFYKRGRNLLVVLGHYGNWEFGSAKMADINYRIAAIYKKLSSPIFEEFYKKMRQNLGVEPVEMRDTLRKLIELRDCGQPFALLSVADQTPTRKDIHHWITFLNQDTGVFIGPERLAKKFNMDVIYGEIVRTGFCKFTSSFTLLTENANQTAEYEITDKFFAMLEDSIKRHPENWVWSHRRWKHKREPQA